MTPRAEVSHALPRRTRLRIRGKGGDEGYFQRIRERLGNAEGVVKVEINSLTGSVVIEHGSGVLNRIAETGAVEGLFRLAQPSPEGRLPVNRAAGAFAALDGWLARATHADIDARSTIFFVLIVLSLVQIARGQVLAPAATLLWYAMELSVVGQR
jgi:hypothetical protein